MENISNFSFRLYNLNWFWIYFEGISKSEFFVAFKIPKIQPSRTFALSFPLVLFMFLKFKEKWATILLRITLSSLPSKTLSLRFSFWNSIPPSRSISVDSSSIFLLIWYKHLFLENAFSLSGVIYFLHVSCGCSHCILSLLLKTFVLDRDWILSTHCSLEMPNLMLCT